MAAALAQLQQHLPAMVLFALSKIATLRKRIRGRALLQEILSNFPGDFAQVYGWFELAFLEPGP